MKLKDIFVEIHKGFDIEREGKFEPFEAYLIDTKDVENCRINYSNNNLKKVTLKYRKKYFLGCNDIVIATRSSISSHHVGRIYTENVFYKKEYKELKIIPKKNFIVLRNCNNKFYLTDFIINYLEYIGIDEYIKNNNVEDQLRLVDVEEMEIPDISLEKQKELLEFLNPINERNLLYKKMIENDVEISKYVMSEAINNEK